MILIILSTLQLKGQKLIPFDTCKDLFDNKEFSSIIPSLKAYASNNPGLSGKDRYLCHYMLSVSFFKTRSCSQGETVFDFMDECWYLPEDTKTRFRNELSSCIKNIETAWNTEQEIYRSNRGQVRLLAPESIANK